LEQILKRVLPRDIGIKFQKFSEKEKRCDFYAKKEKNTVRIMMQLDKKDTFITF
jgi:glutaredoxin 2